MISYMSLSYSLTPMAALEEGFYYCPHFTDEGMEAQGGLGTCLRSHSWRMGKEICPTHPHLFGPWDRVPFALSDAALRQEGQHLR